MTDKTKMPDIIYVSGFYGNEAIAVNYSNTKPVKTEYIRKDTSDKRIKELERQNTELVLDKRAMKSLLIDANEQLKGKSWDIL